MSLSDDLRDRVRRNINSMRAGARASDWMRRLVRDIADAPIVDERWLTGSTVITTNVLSDAELRVLAAASHGLEYQMIADLYVVEKSTVQTQLRSARLKLRAKNTTHACCVAMRRGLIL